MQASPAKFGSSLTAAVIIVIVLVSACSPITATNPQVMQMQVTATKTQPPLISITTDSTAGPIKTILPYYTPTPRLITPAPSEGTFSDQSLVSPDGEWTALPSFETLSNGYRITLKVFNKDKSTTWTPVDDKVEGGGFGYSMPAPRHWSEDSQYLYYSEVSVVDGCSDFFPIEEAWQRLDVATGEVETMTLPTGRGHAISPNDSWLVYTSAEPPVQLMIVENSSGNQSAIDLLPDSKGEANPQGGRVIWSPQSDGIILSVASGTICGEIEPDFYLLKIDLDSQEITSLYEGGDFVYPVKWDDSGKILVQDWNIKSWWIDGETGEITTAP